MRAKGRDDYETGFNHDIFSGSKKWTFGIKDSAGKNTLADGFKWSFNKVVQCC